MTKLTIGDKKLLDDEITTIRLKKGESLVEKIAKMTQDVPRQSQVKNNRTASGEYYEGAKIETIDFLEEMMSKFLENKIPPERAYDVVCALKYLSSRLGSKDDTPYQLDLLKAENYIHRARTGHWFSKNYLKQEEESIDDQSANP